MRILHRRLIQERKNYLQETLMQNVEPSSARYIVDTVYSSVGR